MGLSSVDDDDDIVSLLLFHPASYFLASPYLLSLSLTCISHLSVHVFVCVYDLMFMGISFEDNLV